MKVKEMLLLDLYYDTLAVQCVKVIKWCVQGGVI